MVVVKECLCSTRIITAAKFKRTQRDAERRLHGRENCASHRHQNITLSFHTTRKWTKQHRLRGGRCERCRQWMPNSPASKIRLRCQDVTDVKTCDVYGIPAFRCDAETPCLAWKTTSMRTFLELCTIEATIRTMWSAPTSQHRMVHPEMHTLQKRIRGPDIWVERVVREGQHSKTFKRWGLGLEHDLRHAVSVPKASFSLSHSTARSMAQDSCKNFWPSCFWTVFLSSAPNWKRWRHSSSMNKSSCRNFSKTDSGKKTWVVREEVLYELRSARNPATHRKQTDSAARHRLAKHTRAACLPTLPGQV